MSYPFSLDNHFLATLNEETGELFNDYDIQSTSPEEEYFSFVYHNRHHPDSSYPQPPRYNNAEVFPIPQNSRHHHSSGDSMRHSTNMNYHLSTLSRNEITGIKSFQDPPWSPAPSLSSPQDRWFQSRELARTHSDSSSDSMLPSHRQSQSDRHCSSYNHSTSSGSGNHHSTGGELNSKSSTRVECTFSDCSDANGKPRTFSRKADLSRHFKSMHSITYMDCPWVLKNKCDREGQNGFARKDHLIEHLRGYHGEKIDKRGSRCSDGGEESGRGGRHRRSS